MSLNSLPCKTEVMGWNPHTLADYMRRLKLSGCDKVVIQGSITGAHFMQMEACELQVFPSLYIPIITKIHREMGKDEQKRSFAQKLKHQMQPKEVFVQEEDVWDSDEFHIALNCFQRDEQENDSDNDYEGPDEGEDSYICTLTEQQDNEDNCEVNLDPPSSAFTMKPPQHPRVTKLQQSHIGDSPADPCPAERTSKPPHPHPHPHPRRMNQAPQRPSKPPGGLPNLHVDRSKKPGQPGPAKKDLTKSKGSAVKAPGSSTGSPQPKAPKSADFSNRADKVLPPPPTSTQIPKVNSPVVGPGMGLDPSWYGGKVTRHEAEVALREMNKDGSFLVRDSSKDSAEHPYTLMLLKEGKVYNIKIRSQGSSFSLGNGLKNNKSFPGVKEMITHHAHTPLLLIDATDQSSEVQTKCCLLHPAGL